MQHARKDYTKRIIDTAGLIPEDEPVFLIRAQDVLGPDIVAEWVSRYQELSDHDPLVAASVQAHVGRMDRWQSRFGTKTPDYPATEFEAESVLPAVEPESEEAPEEDESVRLLARAQELYEESFAHAGVQVSIQWEALPFAAQRLWIEKARAEEIKKIVDGLPGSSNGDVTPIG